MKKLSEKLAEELEVMRTELRVINEETAEPSEEEISRGEALLEEFTAKKAEYDKAIKREEQVAEVMRASLASGNRESGDSAKRGPEIMRRVDPYEESTYRELSRSVLSKNDHFDRENAISRAYAAVEQAPRFVDDKAKDRMVRLLEEDNRHSANIARHMLLTGSEQYHHEFSDYVKSQGVVVGDAMRTAMSLTDGNGGYMVPFTLDPTIILTNAGIAGPIRSISTVKTITTDTWNGVTSAGVTAEWAAEAAEAADASPTFNNVQITPKRAQAYIFGSYEILQDSSFASELGRLLADAKVRLEETAFATGNTGATIPRGVVAAVAAVTASIVTSATTNAFVVGDVYNTSDALRPRDASQASWLANKKIYSLIRRFDTSGGGSFWTNLGMGVPQQLLGQPVYESSTMTGVVSTGANVLLAGNFAEYYIVDRVGMSVYYDPMVLGSSRRPTGQAGWYAFWRVGADVVDPSAFRLLQLNTVAAATALA